MEGDPETRLVQFSSLGKLSDPSVKIAVIRLMLRRKPDLKLDSDTPYKHLETLLVEYNTLDKKQIKIFHDLRVLRNKVKHVPQYEVTSDQALEYIALALSLAEFLSTK